MKRMLYTLFILFMASPLWGATFTSTQTGTWNDGATWGNTSPGVAGTDFPDVSTGTDEGIISTGHTITLIQNEACTGLTIGAGATLNLAGYTLAIKGHFQANGTIVSRATIKSDPVDGTFTSTPEQTWITWSYTDIIGLGDTSYTLPGSGRDIDIQNCAFQGNAYIDMTEGWVHLDSGFIIKNTSFSGMRGGGDPDKIVYIAWGDAPDGTPTHERIIENCLFDGTGQIKGILFSSETVVAKNCVFYNIKNQAGTQSDSLQPQFETCLFAIDTDIGGAGVTVPSGNGVFSDHYIYQAQDNPHVLGGPLVGGSVIVENNVFELTYKEALTDCGEVFILGGGTQTVRHNINIDTQGGVFVNALGSSTKGPVYCYNNTLIRGNAGAINYPGTLAQGETDGHFGGTAEFYNNITYNKGVNDGVGIGLIAGVDDEISYTDFNLWSNIEDIYSAVIITGKTEGITPGFGSSDIVNTNPGFANENAGIATFDASLGGPGTGVNAVIEFKKIGTSDYNPAYNVTDLLTHVRAAYTPSNEALDGTAKDGADFGAIAFDTTPPSPIASITTANQTVSHDVTEIVVTGTTANATGITSDPSATNSGTLAEFSFTIPLAYGDNSITITATGTGDPAVESITVTRENPPGPIYISVTPIWF